MIGSSLVPPPAWAGAKRPRRPPSSAQVRRAFTLNGKQIPPEIFRNPCPASALYLQIAIIIACRCGHWATSGAPVVLPCSPPIAPCARALRLIEEGGGNLA